MRCQIKESFGKRLNWQSWTKVIQQYSVVKVRKAEVNIEIVINVLMCDFVFKSSYDFWVFVALSVNMRRYEKYRLLKNL